MTDPRRADARFPIRDVTSWPDRPYDEIGSKDKVWLGEPGGTEEHLCKFVRLDDALEPTGEDWAEKLAAEAAGLIGVRAAAVDLAVRHGRRGLICRRMNRPDMQKLVHGNELLAGIVPGYADAPRRNNPGYTVPNVRRALAGFAGAGPSTDAYETWAGYAVFDAWIANTDRHHQNWGVLVDTHTDGGQLAPTFDHGSSLGFSVRPEVRDAALEEPERLESWCARGRNDYFAGKPKLLDVARQALAVAGPSTRDLWLGRLANVEPDDWRSLIARVPDQRMSEPARTFVDRILEVNRRRLLDVRG